MLVMYLKFVNSKYNTDNCTISSSGYILSPTGLNVFGTSVEAKARSTDSISDKEYICRADGGDEPV